MNAYSVFHLDGPELLRKLHESHAQDCANMAWMLACLGEANARGLYLPKGYPSMFRYCVAELNFSEDAAYKRIRAARMGRRFAGVLPRIADGRLNVSAVVLLAPHLKRENCEDLL